MTGFPFTAEDMRRWLVSRGVDDTCPLCRHKEWQISEIGDIVGTLKTPDGKYQSSGQNMSVVPFVCANCGYVLLFGERFLNRMGVSR